MANASFVGNVHPVTAAGDVMRKYTGVMQFFHNFEHDSEGLNHCHSDGDFPYTIKHKDGKHVISHSIVRGHGRGGKPQWFKFMVRFDDGFDMGSAVRIDAPLSRKGTRTSPRRKPIRITPKTPRLRKQ